MSSDDAKSDLEKMIDCSYICQWWTFADQGTMSWGNVMLMLHGAGMLVPSYICSDLFFLRQLAEGRLYLDKHLDNIRRRIAGSDALSSGAAEASRQHGVTFFQQTGAEYRKKELELSEIHSIIMQTNRDQGGRK